MKKINIKSVKIKQGDNIQSSCFLKHQDAPQHFLNFFPLPQGQGSLRPTFFNLTCGAILDAVSSPPLVEMFLFSIGDSTFLTT